MIFLLLSSAEGLALLPRERYIASNRFQTREGSQAKFEERWATRKSRLATLDGFRYFTLLRQVPAAEIMGRGSDPSYNYMSFTIWDDKTNFDDWRKGDAFKEAHGGTSIGAFLSAMVSSLRVLKGPPSPVMSDGLLHLSNVCETPPLKDGWRVMEGEPPFPAECFVAANRFTVKEGSEADFEARWSKRDSNLKELPGFKSFTMLRRDGGGKDKFGDDWNYMSFTVWQDKDAFMNWRNSQSFKDSHKSGGGGGPPPWTKPPSVAFWEGILEISSPQGA